MAVHIATAVVDATARRAVEVGSFGHADEASNFAQGILLNPGEYEVRIEPVSGGSPVVQKVKIEADKTTIVK